MRPLSFNIFGMDVLSGWAVHDTMPTLLAGVDYSLAGVDYSGSSSAAQARLSSPGRQEGITTSFVELTGADNPFDGIDFGANAVPTFFDVDGDRNVDLIVGSSDGLFRVFRNDGIDAGFIEVPESGTGDGGGRGTRGELFNSNPFDGFDVGDSSASGFVNILNGFELELVAGSSDGTLRLFAYAVPGGRPSIDDMLGQIIGDDNPFDGIDVGTNSVPTFFDVVGDAGLDAIVGAGDGKLYVFENVGFGDSFSEQTGVDNPFDGIDVGTNSKPVFVDLDDDGDTDLVVGAGDGTIRVFDKNDDDDGYTELTGTANPFNGIDVGADAAPAFIDLDDDGDLDAVIGSADGALRVFENQLPPNANPTAAGDLTFALAESATYVLTTADFLGTDIDNRDGDLVITISSVRNGTVLVNGVERSTFTNADIEAGYCSICSQWARKPKRIHQCGD